ncbi:MAG: sulfatase-like hydrolase/transferase [Planctomycetaceae bacterium]
MLPTLLNSNAFDRVRHFQPRWLQAGIVLVCGAILPAVAAGGEGQKRPPNVIFILTDDQGWADARFAGHPYVQTPNLDKLAGESTWIRQFYVAATVCSPSRCGFMTSHYPARHLVHGHFASHTQNEARSMPDWLDPQATTLPRLLQSAGYKTAHFGKWHLGNGDGAPPPEDYGIDVSRTVNSNGPSLGDEAKDPYFRARSTRLIVDETIAFMREHRDQPFYINLWTLLPHAKLNPTPEQLATYESLSPSANDPAFGPWMQRYLANAKDLNSQMQVFCASLTDIDTQMGRLMTALDELKLADNTILFYSSDNGAEDYRIGNASNAGVGNTGPLRARKRSMYEGGVRTLGLVRWPGHVPAGRRDETSIMGGVDFLPTICKLAGVELPNDLHSDGEDVSDIWLGESRPRTRPLHWEWLFRVQGDDYTPPMVAIRKGDWKLFVQHNGTGAQLYNIPKDVGEEHDVAAEHPELVEQLSKQALDWVRTLPLSAAREAVIKSGQPQDIPPKRAANSRPTVPNKKPVLDRAAIFSRWDTNGDAVLSFDEYKTGLKTATDHEQRFKRFDRNTDGQLSRDEFVHPPR